MIFMRAEKASLRIDRVKQTRNRNLTGSLITLILIIYCSTNTMYILQLSLCSATQDHKRLTELELTLIVLRGVGLILPTLF